jgi:glycosyltransferase involved in cell wall biosynthesis
MVKERIVFLSAKNPFSKRDWSGIPYFMMQALQKEFEVEYISAPSFDLLKKLGYYFGKLIFQITGKKYIFDYGLIMAWFYGRHYTRQLRDKYGYKFVFVPAGLTEVAFLNTSIPIISFGDCSTLQLFNYYPSLKNVSTVSIREVDSVEQRAFNKIAVAFFSSSWASEFVKQRFKINNVATVPFGSNRVGLKVIQGRKLSEKGCQLLFVGVDWERKGGDVAIKILRSLLENEIAAGLTIIGCIPPAGCDLSNVNVIEKLDKDSDEGESVFMSILDQTDFFILPTQADCTPIVIAESFSAGVPVLTTDTGGISSLIREGNNGFLFRQNDVHAYVERIMLLMKAPLQYEIISQNCVQSYVTTFNWERWVEEFKKTTDIHLN